MTEPELIEKIGQAMYYQHVTSGFKWENESQWFKDRCLKYAGEILAIIKETLPELAKEVGYVKPPESMELTELVEVLYNFMKVGAQNYSSIKANIQSFLLANHYAQLAEDQSLPRNPILEALQHSPIDWQAGYYQAQQDMLEIRPDGTAFRKVTKEEKDEKD